MSEVNMTPLIDVMLVLMVIFMVAAPLLNHALRLELPQSAAAQPSQAKRFIALSMQADGSLYLDGLQLQAQPLQQRLQTLGQASPDMEVRLRADQAVPYGRVTELVGWCQSAGLRRIAFVTQAPQDSRP
ncbi:ExbD/TolR family protein [Roseateles sp. BYS180W]|uniref:ExbD/TolR family protein n=1 Tax=Roseateles rivi TaxID=3299028 RepID=A0ABW7FUE2_9BURK